jgi:hypothetical protein
MIRDGDTTYLINIINQYSFIITFSMVAKPYSLSLKGVLMKNFNYIFSGNRLYKVIKTYKNLIEVVPTKEPLSKQIARRTYAYNQLQTLGYIILEMEFAL